MWTLSIGSVAFGASCSSRKKHSPTSGMAMRAEGFDPVVHGSGADCTVLRVGTAKYPNSSPGTEKYYQPGSKIAIMQSIVVSLLFKNVDTVQVCNFFITVFVLQNTCI